MFDGGNCTAVPDSTPTDAGVAGAGILISFIFTNFSALLLSAIIILMNLKKSTQAPICRKLLSSFSDQQIITGIGIQSVALAKMKTMAPYHFFICWLLSLLSTSSNLATLLALVNDFKSDWVLRWLRQFLMFVNGVLGILSSIFILQSVMKNLEPRLPIGCVWEVESRGRSSNAALSIAGTIAVIAANVLVFIASTWYLHNRSNPKWLKGIQVVGLFALIAMGIGATIRVIMESQAFGSPPKSVNLVGPSEKDWSFGQLLALLLLILPVINALEIARGEMKMTPSAADDEQMSLWDGEMQGKLSGVQYQPNPLWGSENNLFSRK